MHVTTTLLINFAIMALIKKINFEGLPYLDIIQFNLFFKTSQHVSSYLLFSPPPTSHKYFFMFHLLYAAAITFKLYPSKGQLKFANPDRSYLSTNTAVMKYTDKKFQHAQFFSTPE